VGKKKRFIRYFDLFQTHSNFCKTIKKI